ncbi:MAG: GAF domain-containing protein [Proteobacteria bacterium]|nr:GAF domain-containing protein [Pseudomonadota bacterium]MBU2628312.1 GAF domain-containing protein [Pseudomonadota bacterium]
MDKNQSVAIKKKRDPGKTIEVLFKISEAVNNTRNLDELYKVIHESLDEILNVDNFYIALHNEEKDSITFPYHVDEKDDVPEEILNFSKTPSSTGLVIQNRKPMIFYKKDIIRLAKQVKQKAIGTVSKIWLGAPLIINDRVKGAIVIQSYTSVTAYEKNDLDLLNSVSQHIALAIERKESDEKLTEHRQILEKILESSPVGIALVQNRIFKWVNNEMVKMFGYQSKSDFENKSVRMIYSDSYDYDLSGKKIFTSLSASNTADYEADLVKKDMTLFPAHLRLNSGDESDPMAWTIATITDISLRKAAEKEKYERERLQGVLEMAGAVCHEINQPLQAILGYSELLSLSSEFDSTIKSIKSQATRLGKITRKLSNITHYRTVDYPGNTRIVDIWSASNDTEN